MIVHAPVAAGKLTPVAVSVLFPLVYTAASDSSSQPY